MTSLSEKFSDTFDIQYFIKFLVLLLLLYYFNVGYIAIIDPQGRLFSPFLEENLNYINWIRNSILYSSNAITHLFGVNSYVALPYRLKIPHGPAVETVYACLGLGLMSFWVAFVVSFKGAWKKKILWGFIGIFCIWFINCWRVALLLVALQSSKSLNKHIDHHTLFNIIAYSLIISLVNFYMNTANKSLRTAH